MKASEPIPNAVETPVCMMTLAGRGWLLVPSMNMLGHPARARESWTANKMTLRGRPIPRLDATSIGRIHESAGALSPG